MADLGTCSHCGKTYEKKAFTLNLGRKSLQRCPHCRKFTDVHYVPKVEGKAEQRETGATEEEALLRRIEESRWEEIR